MDKTAVGINKPGLCSHRLDDTALARNFSDAHPPLSRHQAQIEAERCYYCHDAPCITACPTGIDIPSFIARVAQGNERGAAEAILTANPLGGMCARVCPTEILCEQACVRNSLEDKPVEIGLLQRHATDHFFASQAVGAKPLFERAASSGKRVAVVGAGPAGLAAAHGLARCGHAVTLIESRSKLGGLNEYGLASYKTTGGFAQQEVQWLLSIGGITVQTSTQLGRDISLAQLCESHDAVFLGLGLAGVNALGIAEPPLSEAMDSVEGLRDAVDFIAELRQAGHPRDIAVGQRVLVIGGGMTAVDAAVQSRLLGAREVQIVYRRGPAQMGASAHEQAWAQQNGVQLRCWARPLELLSQNGRVSGMRFAVTAEQDGRLIDTGEQFELAADMVLKAIGQQFVADPVAAQLELQNGRLRTDEDGRCGQTRIWAGGDCRHGGRDLTVEAVEHGKRAAIAIDQMLRG
ncbi:NAD(P)-dependent oxidoreductase [Paucibacter sp. APW11]|uniref:dihydrouracil dehydrogenase (NAD(+)) n=1 Tax=Roseateles aquae TaxID=3077235 RepID=A0ABU3P7V5_9BURK|nr:NAD(P)-dependent oxidoreductase [Paucibacter sp. APW11]MDT8998183.1 NAD(P)-dependent oxidoreductase [Paucibacter sp. APW11]